MIQAEPEECSLPKDAPYSIFTRGEKWIIVSIVSFAGLFRQAFLVLAGPFISSIDLPLSPLTANIYLPAIPTIAVAFHKVIPQK
jgi:hypothetical protein